MKKVLSIIALGLIVLSSCKKDHSCECKTNGGTEPAVKVTVIKDTNKKATSTCEAGNKTDNGVITVCTIK